MDSSKQNTRAKGSKAEEMAASYLEAKGYKIIKRNFHLGRIAELDIIARQGNTLVFVEIKSKGTNEFGDLLFSITPKKQRALRRAAKGYLHINRITDTECRFDVITIDFTGPKPLIDHIEFAF